MRTNPVFLEGLSFLSEEKIGRLMIALYMVILSLLLFISPNGNGNILGSIFTPPDIFNFIIVCVSISSSLFIVICFTILNFRFEETKNWITYGNLSSLKIIIGKLKFSILFSLIIVLLSVPLIVYAALSSIVHALSVIFTVVFIFAVLLSLGQVWIFSGILFNNKKVIQSIILWIYLFVYLIISANILPGYNPVLILTSVLKVPYNYLSPEIIFQRIQSIFYINIFLFFVGVISAHFLLHRKNRKNE